MKILLRILFFPFWLISLWMQSNESHPEVYKHHEISKPHHSFTDDELLQQGIDIRNPIHAQRILNERMPASPHHQQQKSNDVIDLAQQAIERGAKKLDRKQGR